LNEAPFLSIVIVNWNAAERLRRCIVALSADIRSGAHEDVEIVVVDNGSRDVSLAEVCKALPEAILIELPRNFGFAGACNVGIESASGEWVATLNNDVRVEAGWIAAMRRAAAECGSACGMLQSCILGADRPSRIDSTGVVVKRGGEIHDRDRDHTAQESSPAGEVFCVSAGAAWYRRRMLDEVSPDGRVFDPDYFMYFEDVDLGWRCRLAGWSARYVPDAVVLHELHGSACGHEAGFVKRHCARNRIRTVLGNGSARFIAGAIPRLARDIVWLLADTGHRAVVDVARAIRAGLASRRALPLASRRARSRVEAAWFTSR
jgi:GT2 family glycosyltransferase